MALHVNALGSLHNKWSEEDSLPSRIQLRFNQGVNLFVRQHLAVLFGNLNLRILRNTLPQSQRSNECVGLTWRELDSTIRKKFGTANSAIPAESFWLSRWIECRFEQDSYSSRS